MRVISGRWWEKELAGCTLADTRLAQRLRALLERMSGALGASLPLACQNWASTKAAYRFFSNGRVDEEQILAGHFQATRERVAATEGTILVVQDTTEFSFQRKHPEAIGVTCNVNSVAVSMNFGPLCWRILAQHPRRCSRSWLLPGSVDSGATPPASWVWPPCVRLSSGGTDRSLRPS